MQFKAERTAKKYQQPPGGFQQYADMLQLCLDDIAGTW